jgi:hypothetical protein
MTGPSTVLGTGYTCGIWLARRQRGLVAVVVDEEGEAQPPLRFGRSPEDVWALLAHLDATVGCDCELVLPHWLAQTDDIARLALKRGVDVWLVPSVMLEAVHVVAHLATGPPARTAAVLARLPLAPLLRAQLRRLSPPNQKQLPLF